MVCSKASLGKVAFAEVRAECVTPRKKIFEGHKPRWGHQNFQRQLTERTKQPHLSFFVWLPLSLVQSHCFQCAKCHVALLDTVTLIKYLESARWQESCVLSPKQNFNNLVNSILLIHKKAAAFMEQGLQCFQLCFWMAASISSLVISDSNGFIDNLELQVLRAQMDHWITGFTEKKRCPGARKPINTSVFCYILIHQKT